MTPKKSSASADSIVQNNLKRKKNSRSRRIRNTIYTILVIIIVVILIATLVLPSDTTVAQSGIGGIFTPIQRGISSVTTFVRGWFGTSSDNVSSDNELEQLRVENELLREQLNNYEELERENERLTRLLDAETDYEDLDPIFSKVIAKDTGVWFETFTLNKGMNDGVKVNMAVVNGDGLIGRVSSVGYNYCIVVSIIDSRSSIAALISRTRDNGMLQGVAETEDDDLECRMYYLSNLGNVNVGDTVYTSGLDSRFPKGLLIGQVTAVSRSSQSGDRYVSVHPAADFSAIEEVFILRKQVETIDALPVVPTATPIPVVTVEVTPTTNIYQYVTPSVVKDDSTFEYPTPTPDPNLTPTPTPAPTPTQPVPEAAWIQDR